ncbi:hypothetical protein HYH02_013881 [Chlamydomonas schloesseri]|uniref:Uncharacterized protein n=1 Tax=Chlamydomonas schloesseri TaxID=2026947 RepID=A0A835T017_9CHLO|nr:hypothetical protein HYH02_013881 [Chlamydomonas schloesseri]|eukprot:KAG2429930.1 hypothetical protein HYH02_013881 [Chlamydomonas schloesseri]
MSTGHDLESARAPKLSLTREWKHPDKVFAEQVWQISYADGRSQIYLDTNNVVGLIQAWAEIRCRLAGQQLSSALSTLLLSGLIKTGKSYTLHEVVVAALAEELAKQPPGHTLKGIRVLRLNCINLDRENGADVLMHDLLTVVMEWAAASGVPVRDREWCTAKAVQADGPHGVAMKTRAGRAVVDLFQSGFQAPVLVLLDELQALLHPTIKDAGGNNQLDQSGAAYIRNVVLRRLLVECPTHVLLAMTGSSMALTWIALAAMPVNGTAPLHKVFPVHLPSAVSRTLMQELLGPSLRKVRLQELLPEVQQLQQESQSQQAAEQAGPQLAAEQAGRQPAAEQVGPQQAAEQAGRQPAAEQVGRQPAAEQVGPQPAAEQAGPQLAAEQAERQPAAEQVGPQQAAEQVGPQQAAEQAGGQPLQHRSRSWRVKTLLELSNDSPALFVTMLDEWFFNEAISEDIPAFVDDFMKTKLFEEVKREWSLSLAHMSDEDRVRVLDLSNTLVGAQILDFPDSGLWRFLQPHMRQTGHGRYYLADRVQRQLLLAVIDRGGKLRKSFTGLGTGLTLAHLELGSLLRQLGEVADYMVGLRRPPESLSVHDAGVADLVSMLEVFVSKAEAKLPKGNSVTDRWEALPAFKQALDSSYNDGSRAWYEQEGKGGKLQSHLDHLVFFLRLCRNVLAHYWRREDLVGIVPQVVLALPELLGMSALDLAERMRAGMSKLEPATIEAAAAAADTGEGEEGRAGASSAGGASTKRNRRRRGRQGRGEHRGSRNARGGDDPANRGSAAPAIGGCGLGSCSKASTALLSSALAARQSPLLGKAVVPRTRALLPTPVRLYPVRATVAPSAFLCW